MPLSWALVNTRDDASVEVVFLIPFGAPDPPPAIQPFVAVLTHLRRVLEIMDRHGWLPAWAADAAAVDAARADAYPETEETQ